MRVDQMVLEVEPGDRVKVDTSDLGVVHVAIKSQPLRDGAGGLSLWLTVDAARHLSESIADALALRAVQ